MSKAQRCRGRKHHHKSEGAANAQIRHLKKRDTDPRNVEHLVAYRCRIPCCAEASDGGAGWVVGHDVNQRSYSEEVERKLRDKGVTL